MFVTAVSDVFIVAAKRTAFGTFGGKFVKTSPTDLMIHASKAALEAGKVNPEVVNSVVIGNVIQVKIVIFKIIKKLVMASSMTRGLTFEPLGFYFDDHSSNIFIIVSKILGFIGVKLLRAS